MFSICVCKCFSVGLSRPAAAAELEKLLGGLKRFLISHFHTPGVQSHATAQKHPPKTFFAD